jgi:hypothetical protein
MSVNRKADMPFALQPILAEREQRFRLIGSELLFFYERSLPISLTIETPHQSRYGVFERQAIVIQV